jgi:hypothetical protein
MATRGSNRSIATKGRHVYGDSQDRVKRIPFGLGQAPSPDAAQKCLRCSFGNIPVIEEVVWTIPLPLAVEEATATFGDTVNLLSGSSSVPGVASIDSTFLINGILQTDILTQGVGVHIFCEPMSFSTIGNAWVAPAVPTAPPPSPDVWTVNDINNGAIAAVDTVGTSTDLEFFPASLEWGADVWRAGWNFINAYQFQWRTSQRELVLNELAADISYFGSFADAEAAGTSEVAIIEYVATVNATYRSKDNATIFLPVNFRRVGSVNNGGATNLGIFHPTRDFDLAPVTWGGLRWQGYGCRGQMYRPVESPCFLERGIPIGMQFVVQDAVHQASMLEALTINNEPFGTNVLPDVNVTAGPTQSISTAMLEQTLDTAPANIPQQVFVGNQVFKGGILKLAIKLKGWEMPGGWKSYCQTNAIAGMAPSVGA